MTLRTTPRMIARMTGLMGLLASLALACAAQAQTPLDTYLTHLKTLRAEFSQIVTDGKGAKVQKAQGTLVIVRPGRFRWELTPGWQAHRNSWSPTARTCGSTIAISSRCRSRRQRAALTATPAGLLSGDGNIRELFTVAPAGRKDGFDWVLVTPRESDADFREARLGFGMYAETQAHGAQGQAGPDGAARVFQE